MIEFSRYFVSIGRSYFGHHDFIGWIIFVELFSFMRASFSEIERKKLKATVTIIVAQES